MTPGVWIFSIRDARALKMGNNAHQVWGEKVKVTRPINAETKSVLPTNFKLGRWLVHAAAVKTCGTCEALRFKFESDDSIWKWRAV